LVRPDPARPDADRPPAGRGRLAPHRHHVHLGRRHRHLHPLDQTDATGVAVTISRLVRSIMATLLDMIRKLLPVFGTLG